MSTETKCKLETPPGIIVIRNLSVNAVAAAIEFAKPRPTTPLPPLVQASFDGTDLSISAIVFINSNIPSPIEFSVYQDYCISNDGNPQLQFFISSNYTCETSRSFLPYTINFNALVPTKVPLSSISSIETFSWDSDPELSRGTETTVQHG